MVFMNGGFSHTCIGPTYGLIPVLNSFRVSREVLFSKVLTNWFCELPLHADRTELKPHRNSDPTH